MQVRPQQLRATLAKGLHPIYLLSSDDNFLLQEACDQIREAAKTQGYTEREVLEGEPRMDWNALVAGAQSMSLFGDKKLIEVRLPSGKPGDKGSKAIQEFLAQQEGHDDCILLLVFGKLDKKSLSTKWCKAIDAQGVVSRIWPLDRQQLPAWIKARFEKHQLSVSDAAIALLCEKVEGNMLAAAQETDKLIMGAQSKTLDEQAVALAIGTSARYSVFDLADAALLGRSEECLRIIDSLRSESGDKIMALWSLHREIQVLHELRLADANGEPAAPVLQVHRVFDQRKNILRSAYARLRLPQLQGLLARADEIDQQIKGALPGDAWDSIRALAIALAGSEISIAL